MLRRERRRLLFLLPFAPNPRAPHGGGRVIAQLLSRLAERHDLALLYLRADHELPIDAELEARCALCREMKRPVGAGPLRRWGRRMWLLAGLAAGRPLQVSDWRVPGYTTQLQELMRSWRPEVVQAEFEVMGQYLTDLRGNPVAQVLVIHDPGASGAWERVGRQRGLAQLVARVDAAAWARYEHAIGKAVHAMVVFTERDQRALQHYASGLRVACIPPGVELPLQALDPVGHEREVLFVGSFIHAPNVDAALWLARSIFPLVRAKAPDATLTLVGDQPPPAIREVAGPALAVTGWVPDVAPYLDRAALVAAPLRLGGGMRIKVLEALALGKALVASPLAAEGLAVRDGDQLVLAEDTPAFADAIVRLLDSPTERAALAGRAYAWACSELSWDRAVAAYEQLYDSLLSGGAMPADCHDSKAHHV